MDHRRVLGVSVCSHISSGHIEESGGKEEGRGDSHTSCRAFSEGESPDCSTWATALSMLDWACSVAPPACPCWSASIHM